MLEWQRFALSWDMVFRHYLPMLGVLIVCILVLLGCTSVQRVSGRSPDAVVQSEADFSPAQLIKTDIDRVADAYHHEIFASLRVLAEKLYRRNPAEFRKSGLTDIKAAAVYVTNPAQNWRFDELEGRYGTDAVQLAFREDFQGDRVRALIAGLGGMMQNAFNGKDEFYMTDDLDPQSLYNSARNVEIVVWRLSNARAADGRLYLLTNEVANPGQVANLSFEREFGKIIGHLDLLARIVADKSNRTLVKMVQSLATAVFFPVVLVK
jgi:hypothetical protein